MLFNSVFLSLLSASFILASPMLARQDSVEPRRVDSVLNGTWDRYSEKSTVANATQTQNSTATEFGFPTSVLIIPCSTTTFGNNTDWTLTYPSQSAETLSTTQDLSQTVSSSTEVNYPSPTESSTEVDYPSSTQSSTETGYPSSTLFSIETGYPSSTQSSTETDCPSSTQSSTETGYLSSTQSSTEVNYPSWTQSFTDSGSSATTFSDAPL